MLIIPLQPLPSQSVDVVLNAQPCTIKVYQRSTGLYVDLDVNNVLTIAGVIAHDRNKIVRSTYLGFIGDLAFIDTQGSQDPDYTGLGNRFLLCYFLPEELTAADVVVPFWTPPTVAPVVGAPEVAPSAPSGVSIT